MIRHRLWADRRGATAVEFAMLLPLLCLLVFGAIAMGVALWNWNALEAVSAETARCLAIESVDCGSAVAGCPDAAGACFAIKLASMRGLSGVTADQIRIDASVVEGGISFTSVRIAYPFSFLSYEVTLSSTNRFPNAG